MSKWLIRVVLLFAIINAILIYKNYQEIFDHYATVLDSHERRDLLTNYFSDLIGAETAQRGYLITDQDEYLQFYYLHLAKVQNDLVRLRRFSLNLNDINAQIDNIEALNDEKCVEMASTIELSQDHRKQEAIAIVKTNRGRQLKLQIHELVTQLEKHEIDIIVYHRDQLFSRIKWYLIHSATSFFIIALLLAWIYQITRKCLSDV
jgi:methyl-accepting chemotaxis protein WspA